MHLARAGTKNECRILVGKSPWKISTWKEITKINLRDEDYEGI
jgi:hypothetical protein